MPAFLAVMRTNLSIEGENLTKFGEELKKLTDKDRIDLWRYCNDAGIPCDPPKLSTGVVYDPANPQSIGPNGMLASIS